MKKVIAFSLWGDNPKYTNGLIANLELANKYYPDFECWFYIHKDTVPTKIIDDLIKSGHNNYKIIYVEGNLSKLKPMTWRFEPIDDSDVSVLLSRDLDSRITEREVIAVNEWLLTDKLFHIMRDHPTGHNAKILGGMFGTRKINTIPSWKTLINKYCKNGLEYNLDQLFLANYIYPIILPFAIVHTTFTKYPNEFVKSFIPYDKDLHFVGEVYEIDGRNKQHLELLKKYL